MTRPNSSRPLAGSTPPTTALTPSQIAHAYAFDSLGCWAAKSCGAGKTIAIVDAYHDPTALSDLQTFDRQFGLPDPSFTQTTPPGQAAPGTNSGWEEEISLDVQWAHAMAPGARILLVEATDSSTANLYSAADYAASNANVVSMSWGAGEYSGETTDDSHFNKPGVTFLASAGDGGHVTDYPAASPYVTSVGGTSLNVDTSGNRTSPETTWSCSDSLSCYFNGGTGGDTSAYESIPTYQSSFNNASGTQSIASITGNMRGYADVASDADPNTGVAVYDTGQSGWFQVGGTSAGAPLWSGLVADARAAGSATQIDNTSVYSAGSPSSYSANFTDITSGQNGSCGTACNALAGWDEPTGLGSPKANALVSSLGGASGPPPPPPPNDFTISANPSTLSIQQGSNGTSTVSTAVKSGSPETVSLSVSGLPPGATASFNPTSVTAGNSSALTVSVGSSTATGSYALTVTGTAPSATHTTPVTLTVTAAPTSSNAIVNGTFASGTLSGWTSSGTTGIASSGCFGDGDAFCALLGSTNPTNGNSSIYQTFTAPTGSSSVSFYYSVTCPDTVRYDWATATLKDNTAGTTTTVLARTCNQSSNPSPWTKVSSSVKPGHSYTLTLTSRDDNYPGDPTRTLYDDVSVQ